MFRTYFVGVLFLLGFSSLVNADNTLQSGHFISTVRFDGATKELYFESEEGLWISGGCQSTYVWVDSNVLGQKEILSLGLAAKMAEKKVWFFGSCHSDPKFFKAHYIVVL